MTDIETSYETGGQDRNYYICTAAAPVDIPSPRFPTNIIISFKKIINIFQRRTQDYLSTDSDELDRN